MANQFQKGNTRSAILTGEEVIDMRQRYARGGVSQAELAREKRVSLNTIARALNGLTWAKLPMPVTEDMIRASEARLMERLRREGLAPILEVAPPPTVIEQRSENATLSLEELMRREALKDEGGAGLEKLVRTADTVLAPDRQVNEFLKEP